MGKRGGTLVLLMQKIDYVVGVVLPHSVSLLTFGVLVLPVNALVYRPSNLL